MTTGPTTGIRIRAAEKGPVHFNWMFREPFSMEQKDQANSQSTGVHHRHFPSPAESEIKVPIELTGNTVIALGRCRPEEAKEVQRLAQKLQAPLLADITSGLTQSSFELPTEFSLPAPDTVLHVGGRIRALIEIDLYRTIDADILRERKFEPVRTRCLV